LRRTLDVMLRTRLRRIKIVLTDVDGCLTDDRFRLRAKRVVGPNGHETVEREEDYEFNTRDGIAVLECRRCNPPIPVVFLSGRTSLPVRLRAEDLGAECYQGVKDKVAVVERILAEKGLEWNNTLLMGNDIQDLAALRLIMKNGGVAAAPGDAVEEVRREVGQKDYLATAYGGWGAFREVVEQMLVAKDLWDGIINRERTLG